MSSAPSATIHFESAPDADWSDYAAAAEALLAIPEVAKAIRMGSGTPDVSALLEKMQSRLSDVKDGWHASAELAQVAREVKDVLWVAERIDRVRVIHERQARAAIREAYTGLWMAGREAAGNYGRMGKDEANQLRKMQRAQAQYFLNFMQDIENGVGRMNYGQRVSRYPQVARQAYWAGYVLGDQRAGRYLKWNLGEHIENHCHDCPALATGGRWGKGIYTAQELARKGVFPGSGGLECCGGCGCNLEECPCPAEAPLPGATRLRDIEIAGPKSSSFHGYGREGREKLAERAQSLGKWTHRGRKVRRGNPFLRKR